MEFDLSRYGPRQRYKLLSALVIPRPIAWVTTLHENGLVNAAPFSFFNIVSEDPALAVIGLQHHDGGRIKDTTRNIRRTGEFVINIVTEAVLDRMVETAALYSEDESETDILGLAVAPSTNIRPPRLAIAAAALECRLYKTETVGVEREVVYGEINCVHARDGLVDDSTLHVDWSDGYPVGRLFANRYAIIDNVVIRNVPQPNAPLRKEAEAAPVANSPRARRSPAAPMAALSLQRRREISTEIDRLVSTMEAATDGLAFDMEPAQFTALLEGAGNE